MAIVRKTPTTAATKTSKCAKLTDPTQRKVCKEREKARQAARRPRVEGG